jgi:hypothetical protein
MSARIDGWLAAACADAAQRGLPELKPLLETLARSTMALRAADAQLDVGVASASPEAGRTNPGAATS